MEKSNHKILRKRIDKFVPYIYTIILEQIRSTIKTAMSEECDDLFFQLIEKIQDETDCLKCDELTACYLVEEGFNWSKD